MVKDQSESSKLTKFEPWVWFLLPPSSSGSLTSLTGDSKWGDSTTEPGNEEDPRLSSESFVKSIEVAKGCSISLGTALSITAEGSVGFDLSRLGNVLERRLTLYQSINVI